MLSITRSAVLDIQAHAVRGYPLEICGFLVGSSGSDSRTVREAWPVRNAWEEDAGAREALDQAAPTSGEAGGARWEDAGSERRFFVSPDDILVHMKRAREAGMDLVGVYHTHPNHPAVPSEFDRSAAWPEWSYVILSVTTKGPGELRSWVLAEDGSHFDEESVEETS